MNSDDCQASGRFSDVMVATSSTQIERILRFRYGVYIEELGKPMPAADHARRRLHDEFDPRATHLYVEREGEVAGTVRIIWGRDGLPPSYNEWYALGQFEPFDPRVMSFTGRLMVAAKYRKGPLAMMLARHAYLMGLEDGIAFDFIHTTGPLVPFFERLGYRRYHSEFSDPDLGPRTPLVLVLDDMQHLISCRSPFVPVARQWREQAHPVDWFNRVFGCDSANATPSIP